jgi:hypothetical protein
MERVEIIIFTFKRSIRGEIVTYRFDVVLESLHMQQLHGFDELRNDQAITRNRNATIGRTLLLLYLSAPYFSFRLYPLAKIPLAKIFMGNGLNRFFWSFRLRRK